MTSNTNQFKSLHIDLEKKIFMLNGKPLDNVTNLKLEACGMEWSLELSRDERYEAPVRVTEPGVQTAFHNDDFIIIREPYCRGYKIIPKPRQTDQ